MQTDRKTDIQTDDLEIIYHAAAWVVGDRSSTLETSSFIPQGAWTQSPSPRFPSLAFTPLSSPPEAHKIQLGVQRSAVSSPSGVWDIASADKRFGAFSP